MRAHGMQGNQRLQLPAVMIGIDVGFTQQYD
jgi:hypothetical protein